MDSAYSFGAHSALQMHQGYEAGSRPVTATKMGYSDQDSDRAVTPKADDYGEEQGSVGGQGMYRQDSFEEPQWSFTAPNFPSPAQQASISQHQHSSFLQQSYQPTFPPQYDNAESSDSFHEPQLASYPAAGSLHLPTQQMNNAMRPVTAPSFFPSYVPNHNMQATPQRYDAFLSSVSMPSHSQIHPAPVQPMYSRYAGFQTNVDAQMNLNVESAQYARGRIFSLPESTSYPNASVAHSRPSTSGGLSHAYPDIGYGQALNNAGLGHFLPYPGHHDNMLVADQPHSSKPSYQNGNGERSNAHYPFSHDPFPVASTSRPSTANRPQTATRLKTGNSARPDTGVSMVSTAYGEEGSNESDEGNFMYGETSLGGDGELSAQLDPSLKKKKRARRRFDEIDRMYKCNYADCVKAYGCLNHLNAHVAAQKHGIKRLPGEFKDMRKEWRAKKKANENADANRKANKRKTSPTDQRPQTSIPSNNLSFDPLPLPLTFTEHHRPATASAGFYYSASPNPTPSPLQHQSLSRAGDSPVSDNPFLYAVPPFSHNIQQRLPLLPHNPLQPDLGPLGYLNGRRKSLPTSNLEQIPETGPTNPSPPAPVNQAVNHAGYDFNALYHQVEQPQFSNQQIDRMATTSYS